MLFIRTRYNHEYIYRDITNVRSAKNELRWTNANGEKRSMAHAFIHSWHLEPAESNAKH